MNLQFIIYRLDQTDWIRESETSAWVASPFVYSKNKKSKIRLEAIAGERYTTQKGE